MQKIMLSCEQATFFSSVKNYRKLNLLNRIQLKLHLMVCKNCFEFDRQSQIIDDFIVDLQTNSEMLTVENLSNEKITGMKDLVNQVIK